MAIEREIAVDEVGDGSVEMSNYSTKQVFHKSIHRVVNRVMDRGLGNTRM
jgi:hypothetical protein